METSPFRRYKLAAPVLGALDAALPSSRPEAARRHPMLPYNHSSHAARYRRTHLANVRLDAAADRLVDNSARIADIAFDVGFRDISHFCRAFRKRFDVTAGDY